MCRRCTGTVCTKSTRDLNFPKCPGGSREVGDSFCYLGHQICNGGGCSESIISRVKIIWKKFRELLLLAAERLSIRVNDRLYDACMRTVMLNGSETWALTAEDMCRLERNEGSIALLDLQHQCAMTNKAQLC